MKFIGNKGKKFVDNTLLSKDFKDEDLLSKDQLKNKYFHLWNVYMNTH